MIKLVVFLALVCGAYGEWKTGLRVKFNVGLRPGTNFFYPIPRTLPAAQTEGWTVTERPSGPLPSLVMYCSGDRIVCVMFDQDDNLAGLQVAVPQDEISGSTLDWVTQGFTEWTATTSSGETKTYWTNQQYFVSEETLKKSKEERIQAFERTDLLREGSVWVSGFNGELIKIANNTADMDNSLFTRQACLPWMGRHYYYNMTRETTCTSSTLLPWFPIVHSGELIAMGLIMHGKLEAKNHEKDWFENPGSLAVRAIVPSGPTCLYDLADSPGLVTMHIYYVDTPWFIGCLSN